MPRGGSAGHEPCSPSTPTRLGIDAHTTAAWRKLDFHPTLAEGAETDPRLSLLVRMLAFKRAHSLPAASEIARDFTFDLDREETCTDAAHSRICGGHRDLARESSSP